MNWYSISQLAPKYVRSENKTPVTSISAMEMRNTRRAPQISLTATRSAVIIEIATGTPAVETESAKK